LNHLSSYVIDAAMGVTSNSGGEARDDPAPGAAGQGTVMTAAATMASEGKAPRTARGAKTMRKILDAALAEFGEKGFNDSSVVSITSRAKVALGTFYTYFDSKEALFAALVQDMSARVRDHVAPVFAEASEALDAERRALTAYLDFVGGHKEVYRIIDEAEFVDPAGFRTHYESTAARIASRLKAGEAKGELAAADPLATEVRAWALMGINVFLGLRFGVWGSEPPEKVAAAASRLVRDGLRP
jgi:AcrR family transcriptional regulator